MRKTILSFVTIALLLTSCGSSTDTPENAAKTFCDLITRAAVATGVESDKLMKELDELENKIEKEHEGDDAWFEEFETNLELFEHVI